MEGYKAPDESFMLFNTIGKPLSVGTLSTICKALDVNTNDQQWLVNIGEGCLRFDLCDFKNESEVKDAEKQL